MVFLFASGRHIPPVVVSLDEWCHVCGDAPVRIQFSITVVALTIVLVCGVCQHRGAGKYGRPVWKRNETTSRPHLQRTRSQFSKCFTDAAQSAGVTVPAAAAADMMGRPWADCYASLP